MPKSSTSIMHEQVLLPGNSPIRVKWNDFSHFTFPWHFHDEMEIVYVLKSRGTRFIADSMERFAEGDLVLVGSQVPHYWKNNLEYYNEDSELRVNAVVVQFSKDFMEKSIQHYPEMAHIKSLFNKAMLGIHFSMPANREIGEKVKALYDLSGFKRMMGLLEILDGMANSSAYRMLATADYNLNPLNVNDFRIEKVLNYINLNYTRKISLTEMARQFGMNISAFSRYFKLKTGKTLIRYINEMRISYACKLLQENSQSISQVCYESGFNNISNFNRFFKEKMGVTPSDYIAVFQ
jgi:AraC-like DNA-binding protein